MSLNGNNHIIEYMYFIREQQDFSIVMEYAAGGTLHQFIRDNAAQLTFSKIRLFSHQLIKGIAAMHNLHIKHQDLKPGNILLNQELTCLKIIDFGEASLLPQTKIKSKSANAGTKQYKAPEQHKNISTLKSDIWSYGCIILQMITHEVPYHKFLVENAICNAMEEDKMSPLDYEYAACNQQHTHKLRMLEEHPELKVLLEKCFEMDYRRRVAASEVLELPVFREVEEG